MTATMVFVHIPKTAGTSAVASLSKLFPSNKTRGYYDVLPEALDGLRLVSSHASFVELNKISGDKIFLTAVRRPVDRIISTYRFWKSLKVEECVAYGRGHLLENKQRTFGEFLLADKQSGGVLDNEMVRQFADVDPNRECDEKDFSAARENIRKLSFILRTENLNADMHDLFSKIGCQSLYQVHHLNVTDENHRLNPNAYEDVDSVDVSILSKPELEALHRLVQYDARLYDFAVSEAEVKRNAIDKSNLLAAVERPAFAQGEKILPCAHPRFLGILTRGWSPIDVQAGNIVWTVSNEALLEFRTEDNVSVKASILLELTALTSQNRKYMAVEISYCETSQRILFLHNAVRIEHGPILDMSFDQICVAPTSAMVSVKLTNESNHAIKIKLPANMSSPMLLGQGGDDRALGVRLLSLDLI